VKASQVTPVYCIVLQNGGFYSAEDADSYPTYGASRKKEGAFCVWTYNEVQSLLSKRANGNVDHSLATVFCTHYDVKPQGNVNPLQVNDKTTFLEDNNTDF
jgi:uncharacterized protein YyaL (SSP411 family)